MRAHRRLWSWRRFRYLGLLAGGLFLLILSSPQEAAPPKVIITEFSDYQCPFCKRAAIVVEQVRQAYGERVEVVVKQMPLPMHAHAFKAAQASLCAQRQGKFWEYHNRLFAASDLSPDGLKEGASQVGLKPDVFNSCLDSAESRAAVESDIREAKQLGVTGTPTFFISDKRLVGALSFDTLKQEIDRESSRLPASTRLDASSQPILTTAETIKNNKAFAGNENSASQDGAKTLPAIASLPLPPSLAGNKMAILPSNPRQLSNSSLQFTASINGEPIDGPVRWSSSNPAVATINSTGNATLLTAGTTTITAVHGGQSASTMLTVTVAVAPVFTAPPADTNVSAVINGTNGGVKVQLQDNLGDPLPNQTVTVSIGTNAADGGGAVENARGTLTGTLTRSTNSSGTVTFSDLKIDWLGNGYTLVVMASPSSGAVSGISAPFNELRVGDPCLGPNPACSSGCADTDHDGLNDAWEYAGGIDLNGDGVITDSYHDVLLPGADPNRPDVYVKYDYMVAPTHSHQPPARAWDQMKAMFAAHGITLHVLAPAAGIPEHQVTTLDPNATAACAGTDFITTQQLRALYFGNLRPAYHYMVFVHDSTTPENGALVPACPSDALCGGKPAGGATGAAEVLGDDAIISFGAYVDSNTPIGIELWTNSMMHELGHNLGLVHGSLADPGNAPQECLVNKPNYMSVMNFSYQLDGLIPASAPGAITPISCSTDADCGPPVIASGRCATANTCFCTDDLGPGSNVCYRPDYAEEDLLNLNETTLVESVGVGGPPLLDDIVWYFNSGGTLPGPSNGSPIDWDNNGVIEDLSTCVNALPPGQGPNGHCPDVNNDGTNNDQMDTTADWTQVKGQFIHLNFQYQCTAGYQNDFAAASGASFGAQAFSPPPSEISFEWARLHHLLHPPRFVSISVSPGCSARVKPVVAGQFGTVRVAVLGSDSFDVRQIVPSSLDLHGAKALAVTMQDVNADGRPDLVATFDAFQVRLHPRAGIARVTGWLKNGQQFSGVDNIRVVFGTAAEDPNCR